jgi:molybdopterin biosynthesis enzyme
MASGAAAYASTLTGTRLLGLDDLASDSRLKEAANRGALTRTNPHKPIDLADARRLVLARARPLDPEPVPLREALGRILARDVKSADPVPGFDNSSMRVALKPGKPTWFGAAPQGTLVFGLPGNPVSAMVTFLLSFAQRSDG